MLPLRLKRQVPGVEMHTFDLRTQEAEAGLCEFKANLSGLQLELQDSQGHRERETLSQKERKEAAETASDTQHLLLKEAVWIQTQCSETELSSTSTPD